MHPGTGPAPECQRLRGGARSVRVLALTLGLFALVGIGGTGFALVAAQDAATPVTGTPVGAAACPAELYGPGAEPWVRAELYFGTTGPDGNVFPESDWDDFLDAEITPRFPDGLTVLTALGQYRGDQGIIQERTQVLIILYPAEFAAESSALLEEIRDLYEQQFQQSSVLRADITPVCTSF